MKKSKNSKDDNRLLKFYSLDYFIEFMFKHMLLNKEDVIGKINKDYFYNNLIEEKQEFAEKKKLDFKEYLKSNQKKWEENINETYSLYNTFCNTYKELQQNFSEIYYIRIINEVKKEKQYKQGEILFQLGCTNSFKSNLNNLQSYINENPLYSSNKLFGVYTKYTEEGEFSIIKDDVLKEEFQISPYLYPYKVYKYDQSQEKLIKIDFKISMSLDKEDLNTYKKAHTSIINGSYNNHIEI